MKTPFCMDQAKADRLHRLNECYYRIAAADAHPCPGDVYLDWCGTDANGFSQAVIELHPLPFVLPAAAFACDSLSHIYCGVSPSPYGYCFIAGYDQTIVYLSFLEQQDALPPLPAYCQDAIRDDAYALCTAAALFDEPSLFMPYCQRNDFNRKIYEAQTQVPPGHTVSYKGLCHLAGYDGLYRQTGRALATNNIAFLIPCHRTVRSDGELCGYRWGLQRKQLMLLREKLLLSQ
jgi:O-6-methylguanine DNA methyltransferase